MMKENNPMNALIACSVCHASIAPGATLCPGCGLPLVAQAVPVVTVQRARFPLWGIIGVALVAFVIFANIASRHDEAKAAEAQAAFVADIANGQLNTASAFEARCGQPRWTKQTRVGEELHYFASGNDYFVTLTSSGPRLEHEHLDLSGGKPSTYRTIISADQLYVLLGCK